MFTQYRKKLFEDFLQKAEAAEISDPERSAAYRESLEQLKTAYEILVRSTEAMLRREENHELPARERDKELAELKEQDFVLLENLQEEFLSASAAFKKTLSESGLPEKTQAEQLLPLDPLLTVVRYYHDELARDMIPEPLPTEDTRTAIYRPQPSLMRIFSRGGFIKNLLAPLPKDPENGIAPANPWSRKGNSLEEQLTVYRDYSKKVPERFNEHLVKLTGNVFSDRALSIHRGLMEDQITVNLYKNTLPKFEEIAQFFRELSSPPKADAPLVILDWEFWTGPLAVGLGNRSADPGVISGNISGWSESDLPKSTKEALNTYASRFRITSTGIGLTPEERYILNESSASIRLIQQLDKALFLDGRMEKQARKEGHTLHPLWVAKNTILTKFRNFLSGETKEPPKTADFQAFTNAGLDYIRECALFSKDNSVNTALGTVSETLKYFFKQFPSFGNPSEITELLKKKYEDGADNLEKEILSSPSDSEERNASFEKLDWLSAEPEFNPERYDDLLFESLIKDSELRTRLRNSAESILVKLQQNNGKLDLAAFGAMPRKLPEDVHHDVHKLRYALRTLAYCRTIDAEIRNSASLAANPQLMKNKVLFASNPSVIRAVKNQPLSEEDRMELHALRASVTKKLNRACPDFDKMKEFALQYEEMKFDKFLKGDSILSSISPDTRNALLQKSGNVGFSNSGYYDNIGKALETVTKAEHTSGGAGLKKYEALYNALHTYILRRDSYPNMPNGRLRFDSAATLFANVCCRRIALLDFSNKMTPGTTVEEIRKDCEFLMIRSKPFRDAMKKELPALQNKYFSGKAYNPDDKNLTEEQKTIGAFCNKLTNAGRKLDKLLQNVPHQMITGKADTLRKQREIMDKYRAAINPSKALNAPIPVNNDEAAINEDALLT